MLRFGRNRKTLKAFWRSEEGDEFTVWLPGRVNCFVVEAKDRGDVAADLENTVREESLAIFDSGFRRVLDPSVDLCIPCHAVLRVVL